MTVNAVHMYRQNIWVKGVELAASLGKKPLV